MRPAHRAAIPVLNGFPRNYKFTLGDRLQNHLTDLLESFIEAVYLPAAEKRPVLKAVNLRLGYDLGFTIPRNIKPSRKGRGTTLLTDKKVTT